MKRRGVTLLHTLVILFAGMIAAGGVAAFASFAYRTASDQELSIKAQFILEAAIEQAKWKIWNQDLALGGTDTVTIDGASAAVSLTDTNSVTASTWRADASVVVEGRTYTLSRTIGLASFPSDRVNWVYNPNNQHYYALVTVRAGMDFNTAHANAKTLRAPDGKAGYLATVASAEEWTWIKSKMLPAAGAKTVLTGGKQATGSTEPSGGWGWSNGETFSYADWQTAEPNNGGTGESLLAVNLGGVQKFFDVPDQPGWTTFLVEAGDWVTWIKDPKTGRHYTFVPALGATWPEARVRAEQIGGPLGEPTYLLSITTSHESNFLRDTLLPTFGSPASGWFGAYQPSGGVEPAGGWSWVSGEPWRYANWATEEPSNTYGTEHVGEVLSSGKWNDRTETRITVPGYWVEAGAPLDWKHNSTTDRWYAVMPVEAGMTWTEANTWAQELGGPNGHQGYLASLTSSQEHQFVATLADGMKKPDGSDLWDDWGWAKQGPYIGARQVDFTQEPSGGWLFTSGESLEFNGWGLGQPDNWDSREHYATLLLDGAGWGWNDCLEDAYAKGFVVEAGEAPYQWKQWKKADGGNDHWYCFMKLPAGVTWTQASAYAKGLISPNGTPGYLVTLTSQAEHSWVQTNLIPAAPTLTSPHNGISWFGAKQEPGSQESKMGWVYDNGESLSTYWGDYSYNEGWREPNESNTSFGAVSSWATNEDAGLLYFSSPTLSFGNYWPNAGYLTYNVIVESGIPSRLKLLESRWRTSSDGAASPHPDSSKTPFQATDFATSLGSYEWPVVTSSGLARGLVDVDAETAESQVLAPGTRSGNSQVFIEGEGIASLPLDLDTNESTGFFAVGGSGGRRQQHYKGTFVLADPNAVNTVAISMPDVDDAAQVYINGSKAFSDGQSLTNRSLLQVGANRIDVFSYNHGGTGTNGLSVSVPIKPYAKPISVLHPNQFGLAIQSSMSLAGPAPYSSLNVEGNVYMGLGAVNLAWGAGSNIEGFLYTTTTGSASTLPHDHRVSGIPAVSWPAHSVSSWHLAATTTHSSGTTLSNPTFSTNGAIRSSTGTLNVSGVYSGRGVINADRVVITGHLRPASPDSQLSILAREVQFGSSGVGDHYIDAVVFADTATIVRPTILTGSLAAKSLSMQNSSNSNLTIRQRDLVWRSKALAKELKLPGYWKPSVLTGTYYRYVGMTDLTAGEYTGGTVKWTLGGRLNANFRPYASPVGRTWFKPTIQMTEASMPSRQLDWWTPNARVIQEKVQTDAMPINNPYPWWPDGGSGMGSRGVWWTGGFDAASQAEIDAMTFNMTTSDDMSAVYINGRLALDHGGKHSESWAGPDLTDRSMIQIGQNRIDIFMADLSGGGALSMSSNITFYPTPPTVPSFTAADDPYNWGLFATAALDMKQNMVIRGDAMLGTGWKRSGGTQTFHGITWTDQASRPAGPTYLGHSVTSTPLLSLPALPAMSEYSTRANQILTTDNLAPQTNNTGVPKLYYRTGNVKLIGTAPWKGWHIIVASNDGTVDGPLNLADDESGVILITYDDVFMDVKGGTANVTVYCFDIIQIKSTSTVYGSLWCRDLDAGQVLNLWQPGNLFFTPERRTFFKLPGYFP